MASSSSMVSVVDPPALSPGNPIFAHVNTVPLSAETTLLNIAGQVGFPPGGAADAKAPAGLKAQMEICLSRIEICLETGGGKKSDLVRLQYYITERAWQEEDALKVIREVAEKWLEGHRPTSTLLVVKALASPEFLCEFDAQAVVRR